jgi:hypothetical protein
MHLITLGFGGLGLLLGMVIGVAAADDQAAVDDLTQQVTLLEKQATGAEQVAADVRTEADAEISSAHADALAQVTTDNAARQAELDARAVELDGREAGLAQREEAVKVLEQQAADGSIPGDGVYLGRNGGGAGHLSSRQPRRLLLGAPVRTVGRVQRPDHQRDRCR